MRINNRDSNISLGLNITNLQGKLIDDFGQPIQNANVYLRDIPNIGSSTNSYGEFTINNVIVGTPIIASHVTFNNKQFLHDGSYKTITLIPKIEGLDEVVITNNPKKNTNKYLIGGTILAIVGYAIYKSQ